MGFTPNYVDGSSYVTPTLINEIQDGIVATDLTDGGEMNDNLVINKKHEGTNGYSDSARSILTLGNDIINGTVGASAGNLRLYGGSQYYTNLISATPSSNIQITLPSKAGVLALRTDGTKLAWNAMQYSGSYTSKPQILSNYIYLITLGSTAGVGSQDASGSRLNQASIYLVWRPIKNGNNIYFEKIAGGSENIIVSCEQDVNNTDYFTITANNPVCWGNFTLLNFDT